MDKTNKLHELTIADVRASQDLLKTSLPYLMRYLFVPVAWPLTVVAWRLGISANAATVLRGILYVVSAVIMAQAADWLFVVGFILFMFAVVSDSVDGNLARLRDNASYFGKFLDGFIDIVGDLVLPMAIAIHLWASGAVGFLVLLVASIGVMCHATSFIVIHRLPLFEGILTADDARVDVASGRTAHPQLKAFLSDHPCGRLLMMFDNNGMNLIFDLRYVTLFIGILAGGELAAFLMFLSGLYIFSMTAFLTSRIARAYLTLDVHRRSRSAV